MSDAPANGSTKEVVLVLYATFVPQAEPGTVGVDLNGFTVSHHPILVEHPEVGIVAAAGIVRSIAHGCGLGVEGLIEKISETAFATTPTHVGTGPRPDIGPPLPPEQRRPL